MTEHERRLMLQTSKVVLLLASDHCGVEYVAASTATDPGQRKLLWESARTTVIEMGLLADEIAAVDPNVERTVDHASAFSAMLEKRLRQLAYRICETEVPSNHHNHALNVIGEADLDEIGEMMRGERPWPGAEAA